MISKEKLSFDPTDAGSIAASDSVGAYIRAGNDGTVIGHVSDALKVNFSNTSIAVTATDLDIRDLAFATDKVDVSGSSVSISGAVSVTQGTSPWVVGDGGGSLTVDAVDLDIRDLNATQDKVQAWLRDGAGTALTSTLVSGKQALDVNIAGPLEINVEDDKANTALESTQKNVTTTSGAILASQLAARRFMWFQNLGNQSVFIGKSGVTTSNGIRMSPGSIGEFRFGPALSLHAVASSGTQDCRVMEAS